MQSPPHCHPCEPLVVPGTQLTGYAWSRDSVGQSGGAVYHLQGQSAQLYLKHGRDAVADEITEEMTRLLWLTPHIAVPQLVDFHRSPSQAWLLTTALPGQTAHQHLENHPDQIALVDALAAFMRHLHAIPALLCPFNSDHRLRMHHALARIEANLVDTEDFDQERQGWTAQQVWTELNTLLPLTADPVVTHGDFSLDNLLVENGRVTGCIDLSRVGIADRYQDLAILANCLDEFSPHLTQRLFEQYGIDPDPQKLRYHLLLDELF